MEPDVTGTIPPAAPTEIIRPKKRDNNKENLPHVIAYRNYHPGFYWRLGKLIGENLSEADRKAKLAMIMTVTNNLKP